MKLTMKFTWTCQEKIFQKKVKYSIELNAIQSIFNKAIKP